MCGRHHRDDEPRQGQPIAIGVPTETSTSDRIDQSRYSADSDEVARAFRDDVARYSDMMSPGVWCLAGG